MVLTADAFWRLAEEGLLDEVKTELIGGSIHETPWQGPPHWAVYASLQEALCKGPMGDWQAFCTVPVNISPVDVFEPEIVVFRDRNRIPIPDDVLLIVEIAVRSLEVDLGPKRQACALAAVPFYWVFDVNARTLRTFEEPSGGEYRVSAEYGMGDRVGVPGLEIDLDLALVFSRLENGVGH
ncbi:Uma2 family endonuclease [bacterium]|nr:MAG: Uma2 family endonuclease [bacterium]